MLTLTPTTTPHGPLPEFTGEPLGDGRRLKETTGCSGWCALPVAAVFGAVAYYFAREFFGEPWGWVAAGLVLCVTASFVAYSLLLRSGMEPPEAAVSPWPLRPGVTAEARFAMKLKRTLAVRRVTAEVTCEEEAQYRVGTDTRTVTETPHRIELAPIEYAADSFEGGSDRNPPPAAGEAVLAKWEFTIPTDAAPSLDAPDNEVTWRLTVTVEIDRHPDRTARFDLHVL